MGATDEASSARIMWPLSTLFAPDVLPIVEGERVYLRVPQMKDFPAWRDVRAASRPFLAPWEPIWPADDLTKGSFRRRLRRYARDMLADDAYPLFVFRRADDQLVGGLTLSNVRRGVCQTASLGYWMGAAYAGQGYMKAAVTAILPVAHEVLHLHRVEAACMPTNQPSIRLLESCGFVREGYSREYLCINGVWEDHLMFARLRQDAIRPSRGRETSSAAQ